MFHPVFRVYKITINVLEQPSHEPSIQASVNSKKEGGMEERLKIIATN